MRLAWGATPGQSTEFGQTWSFRGTKSRNKVSVGEPAEGSLERLRLKLGRGGEALCRGLALRSTVPPGTCACGAVPACASLLFNAHTVESFLQFYFSAWVFPGADTNKASAGQSYTNIQIHKHSKLSTTDLLVLASMKNAANCDT